MKPDQVRLIREELELSQKEFAEALGVKRSAASSWELGIAEIPKSKVMLIAKTFDVSLAWLERGVGTPFSKIAQQKYSPEDFAADHHFSEDAKKLLVKYCSMDDAERREFNGFVKRFLNVISPKVE